MRNPVICAGPAGYASPYPRVPLNYGWLARGVRAVAAWLIRHYGQPTLTEEEAFLAQSTDHADYEQRERWLARRHVDAWRRLG